MKRFIRRENGLHLTSLIRFLLFLTISTCFLIKPTQAQLVLQVTTADDDGDTLPGDGLCLTVNGLCSLRAAIEEANAFANTTDFDVIKFTNIPSTGGKSVVEVTGTGLPSITEAIKISGGTAPNGRLFLDGSMTTSANGLTLAPGSDGSILRGLIVGNFEHSGILIHSDENRVQYSYLGTNPLGDDIGNGFWGIILAKTSVGVTIYSADDNVIGGKTKGNVIGFNGFDGIYIQYGSDNIFRDNLIGVCEDGSDCGNIGAGIKDVSGSNFIGSPAPDRGNTIGFNDIGILLYSATYNTVQSNYVGTNESGDDLGNDNAGIQLENNSRDHVIGASHAEDIPAGDSLRNTIAFNGGEGIHIVDDFTFDNAIRGNSIYENAGQGIDLNADGSTPNDASDIDDGPNELQNHPEIVRMSFNEVREWAIFEYSLDSDSTDISYPLTVDFYIADNDVSGEGKTYIGTDIYQTQDAMVTAEIDISNITYVDQDVFVATATDARGNTSEFSPVTTSIGNASLTASPFQGAHPGLNITGESESSAKIHTTLQLAPTYPNPFRNRTTIRFTIPTSMQAKLSIYDVLGHEIQKLLDRMVDAGTHEIPLDASGLPSGTYFYRLETAYGSLSNVMILAK